MRGCLAPLTPFHAASMSFFVQRARPQMIGGSACGRPATGACPTSAAMACTAARSSGDAAGNPASITSTPSRASARATSSFSAEVIDAPGACSPSRRLVSKIRT